VTPSHSRQRSQTTHLRARRCAAAAAALCALAAGCSRDPTGGSIDGADLYVRLCSACHGPRGTPPPAMAQRLGVRDLADPAVRARLTPALVEQQIRDGSPNGLMPAFQGSLTEPQLRALAAYVLSPALLGP
jgi:mono/diheme cytochrome c family protein